MPPSRSDARRRRPTKRCDTYVTDGSRIAHQAVAAFDEFLSEREAHRLVAAHIAYGLPWLRREVSPRPVIYYALEAGDDVSKRLCATNDKLKRGESWLMQIYIRSTGTGADECVSNFWYHERI